MVNYKLAERATRLIQADPPHASVIQSCLQAELTSDNDAGVRRKSAEAWSCLAAFQRPQEGQNLRKLGRELVESGFAHVCETGGA